MSDWMPYDHDSKTANALPAITESRCSDIVWVYDEFYSGVTLARWTQNGEDPSRGWWEAITSQKDDIGVTHWQPLAKPAQPQL